MANPQIRFLVILVHALPGRFRLRLARVPEQGVLALIQQGLSDSPGVREVRMSPRTGSILVFHDQATTMEELLVHFQEHGLARQEHALRPTGHPAPLAAPATSATQPSLMRTMPLSGMLLRPLLPPWARLIMAARRA